MPSWAKASKVNGLFAETVASTPVQASEPTARTITSPTTPDAGVNLGQENAPENRSDWYRWPLVLLTMIFCFPVGLWFVWTHPIRTKRTKGIWTAAFAFVVVAGMIGNAADKKAAAESLAKANQDWVEGRKAEAATEYRLLGEKLNLIEDGDKRIVLERLIEFDLANGANDGARKTLELA